MFLQHKTVIFPIMYIVLSLADFSVPTHELILLWPVKMNSIFFLSKKIIKRV